MSEQMVDELMRENESLKEDVEKLQTDAVDTANVIADLEDKLKDYENAIADYKAIIKDFKEDRDRQIEELQISLRHHHEQFENLKSHTHAEYMAIAMNLWLLN